MRAPQQEVPLVTEHDAAGWPSADLNGSAVPRHAVCFGCCGARWTRTYPAGRQWLVCDGRYHAPAGPQKGAGGAREPLPACMGRDGVVPRGGPTEGGGAAAEGSRSAPAPLAPPPSGCGSWVTGDPPSCSSTSADGSDAGGAPARTLRSAWTFSTLRPRQSHVTLRSVLPLPPLVLPSTTSITVPDTSVVLAAAPRKREHSAKLERLMASVCTAAPTTSRVY